eukprot:6048790-Amphidinium_carterae.1
MLQGFAWFSVSTRYGSCVPYGGPSWTIEPLYGAGVAWVFAPDAVANHMFDMLELPLRQGQGE